MWKEQILSGIGEDPDKPKIFTNKNERNHSYHQFYPVLAKIRINRGLLYFQRSLRFNARCISQVPRNMITHFCVLWPMSKNTQTTYLEVSPTLLHVTDLVALFCGFTQV